MNYKNLFRKLTTTLAKIEESEDVMATVYAMLQRLVDDFRDDLGVVAGRIYERRSGYFVLRKEYPAGRAPIGFKVPLSYAVIRELLEHGITIHDIDDEEVDRDIMNALGIRTFAAIGIGERAQQIVAFTLKPGFENKQVIYTLNAIRHVINIKLRQTHLEDRVAETRAIQMSLLPRTTPVFGDFDIWGATTPAEEVGGDLYDYLPVSERQLGIAVADAAGHGLPAALQARDAIIGLRMGVEDRLRITATIEKLNRVVSHSALTSRFISVFYGELEPQGTMVYCNAGHPPPLLRHGSGFRTLDCGGLILGPNPEARYARGYVSLERGDVLLAYTDGITEATDSGDTGFGVERLKGILTSRAWTSARALVEHVFDEVRDFSGTEVPDDDQTVVAVIRR